MNAASFSSLSADHQRLQALVGAWRGEEDVAATQWTDAGTATSEVLAEAQFGGLFVVQRYRQRRDGTISFGSHNVFGFDQQRKLVTMHQFDSMGFVPATPATGIWNGAELVLERSSPRGSARVTYIFDGDDTYRMRLQFKPTGSDVWQDMVSGVYRRVSPTLLSLALEAAGDTAGDIGGNQWNREELYDR
ncbi:MULTISPECIES: DUF1579 family protein [unclassified Mesorhizobium]|uniref:DUF1579 family protein n=1 Tax=unclassified Mesorhizobium TaxID=325217 RepID=UPI000BAF6CE2|nr:MULTISPECIES: DUF1579 family protein [unclassified Mesorhizobium]TGT57178.1 DUF1579 domain-containing protein [Mesorhizobium sp. M00.F.Ca.ET.170.01.1.1]AZO10640.1 DUF1579 domain-containing protein [Mesorhizobium sp. M3A.F.Ca.ET.080.04.2.1]PBB88818.1 DUF1579 domain-containing protein [Mesorhizobium sp. WSM3876]RWB66385.1 MAG: DUF1579 domain-containing protein [Mesorhizobium sp.]RWB92603.1 MAG: DUF1579 domain-containing protein [Mesorhizobium sp.]